MQYQRMCSTIHQRVCPHAPPQQVEEEKVEIKEVTKKSKWKREAAAVDERNKVSEEGGNGDQNVDDSPERKKRSFKSLKKLLNKKSKPAANDKSDSSDTHGSNEEVQGEKYSRSKRSPGWKVLKLIQKLASKKGDDCEDVPREHCINVPVEKCHDVQTCDYKNVTKCKQVPHEKCWEEPRQRCWQEPQQKCWQEPQEKCWQEPHEKCWQEPFEDCHEIPHEICEEVKIKVANEKCSKKSRSKRDYIDEDAFEAKINFLVEKLVEKGIATK